MSQENTQEILNLPTTKKYAWKFRDIFLQNFDSNQLNSFIVQKKHNLLPGLNHLVLETQTENLLSYLPAPERMKHLVRASERIVLALKKNEQITIFGDYDVDGTTSCAMLYEFFELLNYPVSIYIPDRLTEGYGLNPIGLQKCAEAGTKVLITVDNGISSLKACELAKELKIDVIITDHHDLPPTLPDAFAILNPKQPDCNFGFPMLAGVGVAFYLMIGVRALLKKANPDFKINLKHFLDYVAIGTIADMAPLTNVNHILCKTGLEVLNQNLIEQKRLGLYELLVLAGWDKNTSVNAYDIGFKIGPRLNASGRLGNALHSVALLKTKDSAEALECAQFLHEENASRQTLQKQMTDEAIKLANEKIKENVHAIVLHKEEWHPGIVGLVASRILEKYYKPTIIMGTNNGKLKGSGRSTHSFDLFSALNRVRHEFISFGGHYHAVGITLDKEKLSWFKNYLNEQAHMLIPTQDRIPVLHIDGILPTRELNFEFLKHLEALEPFGQSNPAPKWLIGPVQVRNVFRIGKDLSQGHAKITFVDKSGSCIATAFNDASLFEQFLETGTDLYVVIEFKKKIWKTKLYLDIIVADFAPVVYLDPEKFHSDVLSKAHHELIL